jgi:hypothetical protein
MVLIVILFLFLVFNATFNNNLVISWRSVLMMEETRVPEKPPTSWTCSKLLSEIEYEYKLCMLDAV